MLKHWWKILGVLLLLFAFIVGLLTPLRPGINAISPSSAEFGTDLELLLSGYNLELNPANTPNLILWIDGDHIINAKEVAISGDSQIKASFSIPNEIPEEGLKELKVSLSDNINGFVTALPRLRMSGGEASSELATQKWSGTVEILEQKSGFNFPFLPNVYESVRNTFYHVALWFAMFTLFTLGVISSIRYLINKNPEHEYKAVSFTSVGMLFGILGLITGAIWAQYTWNKAWSWDIKQTMTAIVLLIYGAFFVLRISFEDADQKARISAVYNIFAFSTIIPLLYVIPRLTESLHPGGQGNPAFGRGDLDNNIRMVFYPAIIGWILLGLWLSNLNFRLIKIKERILENED
ncbi:MAG: cytochrome c biogenesis protein CcsA [Saprospiraceae bacterium]